MPQKEQRCHDDGRLWHIAQVATSQEKTVRDKLLQLGYDAYVPTAKPKPSAKGKQSEGKALIPCIVFVRINEEERLLLVHFPFISKFMVDKSAPVSKVGRAVPPFVRYTDEQMEKLKARMETADIDPEIARQYPLMAIQNVVV